MSTPRKYTSMLLSMIEEGLIDRDEVILALVNYLSDSDIYELMKSQDYIRVEE